MATPASCVINSNVGAGSVRLKEVVMPQKHKTLPDLASHVNFNVWIEMLKINTN